MRTVIVAALIVTATALTACATASQVDELEQRVASLEAQLGPTANYHTINGDLATRLRPSNKTCIHSDGSGSYDADSDVYVISGSGETLSHTKLGEPTIGASQCHFYFALTDVPDSETLYTITVEGSRWTFTRTELDENAWTARLNAR